MRMLRALRMMLCAAALGLAGVPPAGAQNPSAARPTPETLQAAKDLVGLMSGATVSEMTSDMTAKVWPQLEAALRTQYPKIDAATLSDLRAEYEKLVSDTVTDAMKEAPPIYARYFTAAEMNEIATFYKTPTGAKALTVMPKAMADFLPILLPRMQQMQGLLGAAFDKVLQQHGLKAK